MLILLLKEFNPILKKKLIQKFIFNNFCIKAKLVISIIQDKEDMLGRLEELRQKMIETSQTNLDRVIAKKEKEWAEKMRVREEELKTQFQLQKQELEV